MLNGLFRAKKKRFLNYSASTAATTASGHTCMYVSTHIRCRRRCRGGRRRYATGGARPDDPLRPLDGDVTVLYLSVMHLPGERGKERERGRCGISCLVGASQVQATCVADNDPLAGLWNERKIHGEGSLTRSRLLLNDCCRSEKTASSCNSCVLQDPCV